MGIQHLAERYGGDFHFTKATFIGNLIPFVFAIKVEISNKDLEFIYKFILAVNECSTSRPWMIDFCHGLIPVNLSADTLRAKSDVNLAPRLNSAQMT